MPRRNAIIQIKKALILMRETEINLIRIMTTKIVTAAISELIHCK